MIEGTEKDRLRLPLLFWVPPVQIVAFPSTKRQAFIAKNAAAASRYNPKSGQNYLASLVEKHRDRLLRLGVSPAEAEADTAALNMALHAELARRQRSIAS